ncbi:TauD/TfdA family dioxygenase [Rhizobium sp.]|jgi:hypothetical protein|uniref:TauD/TfdA family dioxygenase n=1 Tax=Rhizobium sp. TaxID=391 RepID=UPI000E8882B7|nr:hypothetical protein [Rhizobium sp.]
MKLHHHKNESTLQQSSLQSHHEFDGHNEPYRSAKRIIRHVLDSKTHFQLAALLHLALSERGWPIDTANQLHLAAGFIPTLTVSTPALVNIAKQLLAGAIDAVYISNLPEGKDKIALFQLAFTHLIGKPFNYASQNDGMLVMELRPAANAGANTNATTTDFEIHTDDAAMPRDARTEFIVLGGVVNPPGTLTGYASTIDAIADMTEHDLYVLGQKRFQVRFPTSFGLGDNNWSPPISLLTGSGDNTELRFPSYATRAIDPEDTEAATAIVALKAALNRNVVDFPVDPGTMLVFNNTRGAHRRGAIGEGDRLVLRTYAARSFSLLRQRSGVDGPIFPINPFIPNNDFY